MSLLFDPSCDLAAGLYAALNVSTVTALAPGGIRNDDPENPDYPWLRVQVFPKPVGGLADATRVWDCDIEVHVWSQYRGDAESQQIVNAVIGLLHKQPLAVDGYTAVMVVLDEQGPTPLPVQELNGKPTRETVVPFRTFLQRA